MIELARMHTNRGWLVLTARDLSLHSNALVGPRDITIARSAISSVQTFITFPPILGLGRMRLVISTLDRGILQVRASHEAARHFVKVLRSS